MNSLHSCRSALRQGIRCLTLLTALLLGFASPSSAALVPTEGTFSGVYYRDRWGVGHFAFYLVSPALHERLPLYLAPISNGLTFRHVVCMSSLRNVAFK